jgi:hypothetical protein
MSTTTTNFGWTVPSDTDLVKDGAAAIRTALGGVDTSFVDLKGGTTGQVLSKASGTDLDFTWVAQDDSNAIQNAIVDAKGDLIAATAADTPARLAVGTNGQVLTADSTASTGLAWATPTSGSMTLLSTTTLSGSSTSISITPTGYNQIAVVVSGVTLNQNGNLFMGLNSDTTASNYIQAWYGTENVGYYSGANVGIDGVSAILPGNAGYQSSNGSNIAYFTIYQPNSTQRKLITAVSAFYSTSNSHAAANTTCDYVTTSALSSVQLKTTVGSFTAGTVLVYGVK